MRHFFTLRWLINKQIGITLLWLIGLFIIASLVNIMGIQITGDIQKWTQWLKHHASAFLVWRILLYLGLGYIWYHMRYRVIKRESQEQRVTPHSRFRRMEIAIVCALLLLEISNTLNE